MAKFGERSGRGKRKRNNDTNSQVVAPVAGAGANPTLAACTRSWRLRLRPRPTTRIRTAVGGKYSAPNSCIPSIPREIMFNILLRVPASLLQEIARFVCKEWNDIIIDPLFIKLHLLRSLSSPATAFLIQDKLRVDANLQRAFYVHPSSSSSSSSAHANANANNTTSPPPPPQYDYAVTQLKLPFQASILGSCNGLLLLHHPTFVERVFCVFNPVTKANICLPPFNPWVLVSNRPSAALVFVPSSGHYKVVYASCISNTAPSVNFCVVPNINHRSFQLKIMVCTIGIDKTWRDIDCQGITMMRSRINDTLMSQPFSSSSTNNAHPYIYWLQKDLEYGFALDVDAETMYRFSGPKDFVAAGETVTHGVKMIDTGGVGMMQLRPALKYWWKVWEMVDPKTGTWVRAMDFDAPRMCSKLDSHFGAVKGAFFPGGSVPLAISMKTGELWVSCRAMFDGRRYFVLVCYNWKTGNVWSPHPVKCLGCPALPHLHSNSLLSPNNL